MSGAHRPAPWRHLAAGASRFEQSANEAPGRDTTGADTAGAGNPQQAIRQDGRTLRVKLTGGF